MSQDYATGKQKIYLQCFFPPLSVWERACQEGGKRAMACWRKKFWRHSCLMRYIQSHLLCGCSNRPKSQHDNGDAIYTIVLQLHAHDEPSPVCLLICLSGQTSTKPFHGCRIQRDVEQYTQFVKPMFDQYVAPSRKHANVIISWARYGSNLFPM